MRTKSNMNMKQFHSERRYQSLPTSCARFNMSKAASVLPALANAKDNCKGKQVKER